MDNRLKKIIKLVRIINKIMQYDASGIIRCYAHLRHNSLLGL